MVTHTHWNLKYFEVSRLINQCHAYWYICIATSIVSWFCHSIPTWTLAWQIRCTLLFWISTKSKQAHFWSLVYCRQLATTTLTSTLRYKTFLNETQSSISMDDVSHHIIQHLDTICFWNVGWAWALTHFLMCFKWFTMPSYLPCLLWFSFGSTLLGH